MNVATVCSSGETAWHTLPLQHVRQPDHLWWQEGLQSGFRHNPSLQGVRSPFQRRHGKQEHILPTLSKLIIHRWRHLVFSEIIISDGKEAIKGCQC